MARAEVPVGKRAVGMYVDREALTSIEELDQERRRTSEVLGVRRP